MPVILFPDGPVRKGNRRYGVTLRHLHLSTRRIMTKFNFLTGINLDGKDYFHLDELTWTC